MGLFFSRLIDMFKEEYYPCAIALDSPGIVEYGIFGQAVKL